MRYIYLCAILTMASCSADTGYDYVGISCTKTDTGSVCSENGNAALMIPEKDIPSLEALALQGSGEAALKLGNYYLYVANNSNEGNYWITISAKDGYPVGMYSLAAYLRNQVYLNKDNAIHDPVLRARYWLERAKDAGYKPASNLLETIN